MKNGLPLGCGKCLTCRTQRRRIWTHRLMLECSVREDNSFLTLTYDDEHLNLDPETGLATLCPRDTQLFLKRLRKAIAPLKLRFYLVGEYGDVTGRPHYHVALFGFPPCQNLTGGNTCNCQTCSMLRELWGKGSILLANLEPASCAYVAGYVTKKLVKDISSDLGRHPEFQRMSNRPGIGADVMDELASTLLEHDNFNQPDVPSVLMHGRDKWPLGRYLVKRLRKRVGKDEKTPPETLAKMEKKMQPMRDFAEANAPKGFKTHFQREAYLLANEGRTTKLHAKHKRKQSGSL